MPQIRYQIFQLSARAVMSYAVEADGVYTFDLSASATEKCKSRTATHEQDSNALFFQTMCVLWGDGFAEPSDGKLISDLSDAIFYMDFDRVFDRSAANKKQRVRQEKARAMFRPEGVGLDFGSGPRRYVAFERSGSMSRQARLSFIRADLHDAVRQRIMLGMDIDRVKDVDVILTRSSPRFRYARTSSAPALTNAVHFPRGAFYTPGAVYLQQEVCTLLRNPHIARNEEIQLSFFDDKDNTRHYYFHQLTDVVMVNSNMLAAERLGGADYDGDILCQSEPSPPLSR